MSGVSVTAMPVFKLARFQVKPEAREQAERAMHEFASYVRKDGTRLLYTDIEITEYHTMSHPLRRSP